MTKQSSLETHGFQTEARKLLKLVINSLYSNREIFLRELISNASDAVDRLRFAALDEPALIADDAEFRIVVEFDKDAGTITVMDNGIGMSRDEAVSNLGTIAKSGSEEFFDRLTGDQRKDSALIGQFGVGFYSSFIVAERVEVVTRRAGEDAATRWTSSGEDEYTVETVADAPRGTRVTLTLKPDALEFADDFRLRSMVRRYSDHVGVAVMMAKQGEAGDSDQEAGEQAGEQAGEPPEGETEQKAEQKAEQKTELEVVNSAQALWTRSRADIDDAEYKEFYKYISHDFEDPAAWSHNKVEGKLEYTSLLYVPKRAPFDLWNRGQPRGLKLYVQRVFIMDDADQFLPLYLRFMRGIVDSSDLPLNVSREILQEDERIQTIKSALTRRVLDLLGKLDAEVYGAIWDEFGQVLKEGIGEDPANKEALLGLLRFASTHDADAAERTSLKDYIGRMKTDVQGDKIYYLIADSDAAARQNPHLEAFRKHAIEVLLLTSRLDEWWASMVDTFDGKEFRNVARGDLPLEGAATDAATDADADSDQPLLQRIGEILGDKVEGVRASKRLTDSPACLVLGEHDLGMQMRRILEAAGQATPDSRPYLEVNLEHPLITRLDEEVDEDRFKDLVAIIFDQASLAEGNTVAEPGAYVQRLNKLLVDLMAD